MVNGFPYIVGDFVWTALDYLGEYGPGTVVLPRSEGHQPEAYGAPYHVFTGRTAEYRISAVPKGHSALPQHHLGPAARSSILGVGSPRQKPRKCT